MKKRFVSFIYASLMCLTIGTLQADTCCSTSVASSSCNNDCGCTCRSTFIPRSAGDNLRRQATYRNYEYGQDCFHGSFGVDYTYQRSFKDCRIARSLFGTSTLHFQGSTIKADSSLADADAILADNFGLSPDTNSFIAFSPRITNSMILDFELYLGLDELHEGLFLQFNAPLQHSKWELCARDGAGTSTSCNGNCASNCNSCDNDCCQATLPRPAQTPFNPGCMGTVFQPAPNDTTLNPVSPAETFTSALSGDFLFGDMQTRWTAGRFNSKCSDDTKLASFNIILGYNFYECPDYNFGVFLRTAAPTGTNESECCIAKNVFSTRIGDNHWKLGGGITGHAELYNCDEDHFVNVYIEGYAEHLFSRCQVRSFDFRDKGCLSRYMLLKEFDPTTGEYLNNMINGINFATRKVSTSIDVQGEAIVEFIYSNSCGFSGGLGWNLYGRSAEEACSIGSACDATIAGRAFGFKGCAPVETRGYQTLEADCPVVDAPVTGNNSVFTLNSTQSDATIHSCGTTDSAQNLLLPCVNGVSDGVIYVNTCANDVTDIVPGTTIAASLTVAQDSSSTVPVIVVTTGAVTDTPNPSIIDPLIAFDRDSGLLKSQVTNKIFGHIDYAWTDCDWTPMVYLGAEVELASEDDCQAMNAWGIFLGANVSF